MEATNKIIDLKKGFKESKSKLYRNLPNFVINYLRRVIREKQINEGHFKYKELVGMDYVNAVLFDEFNIDLKIRGTENIDKRKKCVYVANHPLGAIDALSFLHLIAENHGRVISPSNELFEYIPNIHSLIVGLNVFGQNTKAKIKAMNQAFETDAQIMFFPAGTVSRKIKGEIKDVLWQKTFVSKAIEFNRDIIPVYIDGRNSNKFYRIANIRTALGIKTFIESSLLPQEMLKKYNSELNMVIGKPITIEELKNSKIKAQDWAEKIRKYVYSLREQLKVIN